MTVEITSPDGATEIRGIGLIFDGDNLFCLAADSADFT